MRHRLALITTFLILVPSIATAQSRGARRNAGAEAPDLAFSAPQLRARDLEDLNPLKVLIDKKKDLKLSDEQVNAFKQADEKLKEAQSPYLKRVDSLSRATRPGAGEPSEAERIQQQIGRRFLMETIDSVRTTYEAAGKEAVATLDAETQAKANELIAKKVEDANKRIRERSGGGRGGPGGDGRGRPGGPPAT